MPRFEWNPSEGATRHRIKVYTEDKLIQTDVWVAALVQPLWSDDAIEDYLRRCIEVTYKIQPTDRIEFYHD